MIEFKKIEKNEFTLLELLVEHVKVDELKNLEPPNLDKGKALILSGRMPIWVAQYLLNYYSSKVKWIAQFDPRFGAVVLVSNYINEKKIFEIIPIKEVYEYEGK